MKDLSFWTTFQEVILNIDLIITILILIPLVIIYFSLFFYLVYSFITTCL